MAPTGSSGITAAMSGLTLRPGTGSNLASFPSPEQWNASRGEVELRERVAGFLGDVPGMAVVVDDAANFGHQAAATMLMDSLTGLGYRGDFTVVAPVQVRERLANLVSDALGRRIQWVEGEFDVERPVSDVRVRGGRGLAGDSLVLVAASDKLDADASTAEAFLDFAGTDRAVVLKPYAWGDSHRMLLSRAGPGAPVRVGVLEARDVPADSGFEPIADSALFRFDVPRLTGAELRQVLGQVPGSRGAGLQVLARAVESGRVDVMPVYGLHNVAVPGRASAVNALAAGVRQARIGKPAVVLGIGGFSVDFAPRFAADWLVHADLGAADLGGRIAGMGPGQVMILDGGRLPQDVFRQVYQWGSLPAVLEGANTANLVQLLGRPFFSALTHHTPYDRHDPDVADGLERVTEAIVQPSRWAQGLESVGAWEEAQQTWTALEVLRALPPADDGLLLTADEFQRLTDALEDPGEISDVLGDGPEAQALLAYDAMQPWKYRLGPPEMVISAEQRGRLQGLVRERREELLADVRKATGHLSTAPVPGQVSVIADAVRDSLREGTRLHEYFRGLAAQAHDWRNDQVLQALSHVLPGARPVPVASTAAGLWNVPRPRSGWDTEVTRRALGEKGRPHTVAYFNTPDWKSRKRPYERLPELTHMVVWGEDEQGRPVGEVLLVPGGRPGERFFFARHGRAGGLSEAEGRETAASMAAWDYWELYLLPCHTPGTAGSRPEVDLGEWARAHGRTVHEVQGRSAVTESSDERFGPVLWHVWLDGKGSTPALRSHHPDGTVTETWADTGTRARGTVSR
ncbi:hypothetical protein, partial [Streptomyces sp. NPDC093109]|uniref:hypothetical protein n=1 Tax=Streptomyces sp. NPDC093109 TaxID=3154977 RepID=UPI00344FB1C0